MAPLKSYEPAVPSGSFGFWAVAFSLFLLRVLQALLTWEPGWSALTWDDFTRVGMAQLWARNPFLIGDLVWLPLPTWINGLVFLVAGGAFSGNPMALVAIVNTSAVVLSACVIAWTAWRIFQSRSGTLIAFAATLFAPWGVFLGGSGLIEPLFYLAVAVASASMVAWVQGRRLAALAAGSAAVGAAAAMRYEGWWLVAAWFGLVAWEFWRSEGSPARGRRLSMGLPRLAVAAIPFLVPAAWMVVNWYKAGSPFYFATQSSRIFLSAYGPDLFDTISERVSYYPLGLVRSAPLLLLAVVVVALHHRRRAEVAKLAALYGVAFTLFYTTSLLSSAVGAFPERFLFSFVLGMAPVLGGLPEVLGSKVPRHRRTPVIAGLVALAVVVTTFRTMDRPQEWMHAPDLLRLAEALADIGPMGLAIGPGMGEDVIPLDVRNGDRNTVVPPTGTPVDPGSGIDLWVERNPSRVLEFAAESTPAVGRYRLFGPLADRIEVVPCPGCDGWNWIDETGIARPAPGNGFLAMEFITDDPLPGERVTLVRSIPRFGETTRGHLDLRWLFGHGFNRGRLLLTVTVDGTLVFSTDISEPSRWTRVPFELAPGNQAADLRVVVEALPGIEQGWGWGRASTVLIRELAVTSR